MVVAVPFVLPVLLPLVVGFVILRKRYIMTSREVSLQPAFLSSGGSAMCACNTIVSILRLNSPEGFW